ncbi:MAG TPA: hypothetical protein VFM34_10985 [Moraxellaceae bacterium]|nr:hypothetical protein [Moraxellaceae bacterium]
MVKGIRITASALWFVTALAHAAPAGDRLVLDTMATDDSDGLRQQSVYAGAVKALPSLGTNAAIGVRAGFWELEGPGQHVDFTALRVDHQQALGPTTIDVGVHQLFGNDWSPTLGHAAVSVPLAPVTLEAGVERALVDTVIAARRETTFDTWNATADYTVSPQWTVVGGGLLQDFSDGNQRQGGVFKVVYSPSTLEGFNAQLRLRRLDADRQGIGYFSPDRFEEGLLLLQYGHPLPGDRFVLTGQVGGGVQRIDSRDNFAVFVAELRARGWFTDTLGMEGKLGCTNTGDIAVGAATGGYRYCYANLTLMRPW